MIICNIYKTDSNKILKRVQHDLYLESVGKIFVTARKQFVRADSIMQSNLLITEKSKEINSFDHSVLQDAHDIMAATYRYRFDDGGQQNLFEFDINQNILYIRGWTHWLEGELENLGGFPRFVRNAVESVVFENTQLGYMAENNLCDLLITHYGLEDWAYSDGYVKTYPRLDSF